MSDTNPDETSDINHLNQPSHINRLAIISLIFTIIGIILTPLIFIEINSDAWTTFRAAAYFMVLFFTLIAIITSSFGLKYPNSRALSIFNLIFSGFIFLGLLILGIVLYVSLSSFW